MQSTTQTIETNSCYHGEGLNTDASYDRIYSIRNHTSAEEALHQFQSDFAIFEQSAKSRFNTEIILPCDQYDHLLQSVRRNSGLLQPCSFSGLIVHPQGTALHGFVTLKLEYNIPERSVDGRGMQAIQNNVSEIFTTKSFNFDNEIAKIQEKINEGYTYTMEPTADDLWRLWNGVFDYWTPESIKADLDSPNCTMIGVHDRDGNIAAGAMLDLRSGESTERATHPDHQRKGLMQTALLGLHASAIKQGFNGTVRGDMRYNSSTGVATKIGMEAGTIAPGNYLIQSNHVNVGNTIQADTPDLRNINKEGYLGDGSDNLHMSKLRSFVVMNLSKVLYQQEKIDAILRTTQL